MPTKPATRNVDRYFVHAKAAAERLGITKGELHEAFRRKGLRSRGTAATPSYHVDDLAVLEKLSDAELAALIAQPVK